MLRIKYRILYQEGTDNLPEIISDWIVGDYTDGVEKCLIGKIYNDEYVIFDDGQPEPTVEPTQLDRVEAQATYTAMMTDTLLESEA